MFPANLAGASALYKKLNNLYGSPYEDNREERENAISRLLSALKSGVDPETMFKKIDQINNLQGNYKQKLNTLINGGFWEKTYSQKIDYKPLNLDE